MLGKHLIPITMLIGVVIILVEGKAKPEGKVETSTVPILRPPSTQDDDDAIIIEADPNASPSTPSLEEPFDTKDCLLPRVKGPCRAIIESWHYSTKTKRCESFSWSGCGGNNNRFSSLEFCQFHCSPDKLAMITKKGSPPTPIITGNGSKCEENPCGPRKCGVVMDTKTGCAKCECDAEEEKLPIGSVSGNPDSSTKATKKIEKPEDVCILPETRGNCRAMMTRWRYNAEIKDCVQFHFGGCDGNSNNFVSKEKCNAFCKGQ